MYILVARWLGRHKCRTQAHQLCFLQKKICRRAEAPQKDLRGYTQETFGVWGQLGRRKQAGWEAEVDGEVLVVGTFNTLVNRALGGEGSWIPNRWRPVTHTHTSKRSETSVLDLLTRRIEWCGRPTLFGHFSSIFKINPPAKKNWAWFTAPMDAPRQKCSISGIGSIKVLLFCWYIDFVCVRMGWPIQLWVPLCA